MFTRKPRLIHLLLCLSAVVALLIVLGSGGQPATRATDPQGSLPAADAQQLWKYITADNPYKNWKSFPNLTARFLHVKENPHGDWIAVYLNDQAYQSITNPAYPFQMEYASIVVKENYALTTGNPKSDLPLLSVPVVLSSLTVMYKIKGYQRTPAEKEWFWVMYGCSNGYCDGNVATIGNQPWLGEQIPGTKETFEFYKGEVISGKPWLCVECHQRAANAGEYAFGDYVFKLPPFAAK